MREELRRIVERHGRLSKPMATVPDDADLFNAGFDSLAVVNVMLAIEETFGVELSDASLSRKTFSSIAAIEQVVRSSQPSVV